MSQELKYDDKHGKRDFDTRRFDTLVLFYLDCIADISVNRVPIRDLHAFLFFTDFQAYAKLGKSITGSEYIKTGWGPQPVYDIDINTWATIKDYQSINGPHAILNRISPQLTTQEIEVIREVLHSLLTFKSSFEQMETKYNIAGCRLTQLNETIPYFSVCLPLNPANLTEEEIAYGKKLAANIEGFTPNE